MTSSPVRGSGSTRVAQAPPAPRGASAAVGDEQPLRLPEGIVTGEAVLLELRPASFATRALALALDALVLFVTLCVLELLVVIATAQADSDAVGAAGLAVAVVVVVGLPTTVEALSRGRSVGKAAAGLRVVRDDGGPVRVRQALVRALLAVGEVWALTGAPALITSLAHPQGKRLGDLVAGTVVVRDRVRIPPLPPLQAPSELAAWVRSADIARLPDDLAVAARTVLSRAHQLNPASRELLLAQLATRVHRLVAPPPPPGTPPERLLAAVLHERRERDRARLELQRERRDSAAAESARLQGL